VIATDRRAYVIARLAEETADFGVDDGSLLAGCPVELWLDVPRALDADGRQRRDLFAFCLRSRGDRRKFRVGDRVRLTPGVGSGG
jgi:hypothetical protein